MESEFDKLVRCRSGYMVWGDLDKPFHRPECECDDCEEWRESKGRPTHKYLRRLPKEPVK